MVEPRATKLNPMLDATPEESTVRDRLKNAYEHPTEGPSTFHTNEMAILVTHTYEILGVVVEVLPTVDVLTSLTTPFPCPVRVPEPFDPVAASIRILGIAAEPPVPKYTFQNMELSPFLKIAYPASALVPARTTVEVFICPVSAV